LFNNNSTTSILPSLAAYIKAVLPPYIHTRAYLLMIE
jgi:hypothetical protein